MQEHIVDIILIAIVVLMTFRYYRRGLVGTIFKFGSFIVALVAARVFCGSVTDWVYSNTKLFGDTERYIAKLIIFILIYIVIRLAFSWIISFLESVKKLPVLKKGKQAPRSAFGTRLRSYCGYRFKRRTAGFIARCI